MEDQVTRPLRCHLTAVERENVAAELASLEIEVEDLEREKKAANAQFRSQLEELTNRRQKLARAYRDGFEVREIGVVVQVDYDKRLRTETRVDTGEVIFEQPL